MKRITLGILFSISNFITAMEIDRIDSEMAENAGLVYLMRAAEQEIKERAFSREVDTVDGTNKRRSIRIQNINNNNQKAVLSLLTERPNKKKRSTYSCIIEGCLEYFTSVNDCNEHINKHFEQSGDYEESDSESTTDDIINTSNARGKRGRKPEVDWSKICTIDSSGLIKYHCLGGCSIFYENKNSWHSHMFKKHREIEIPKLSEFTE